MKKWPTLFHSDESVLRRVAVIFGDQSSSGRLIAEYDRRIKSGENVIIVTDGNGSFFVFPKDQLVPVN